ncbi:MAG: hypothetical protein JHD31_03125, partial [Rhodoluna sp.]|nr:hypothetical protein [Rhodoluna sp.]
LDEPLGAVEEVIPDEPQVTVDEILKVEVLEESAPQSSPPASTSRWAEVLFGSKHEDETES